MEHDAVETDDHATIVGLSPKNGTRPSVIAIVDDVVVQPSSDKTVESVGETSSVEWNRLWAEEQDKGCHSAEPEWIQMLRVEANVAQINTSPAKVTISTGLTMCFEGKPEPGGKFSDLYLQNACGSTASVNVGDYRLYVGGDHIHLAFLKLFEQSQQLPQGVAVIAQRV